MKVGLTGRCAITARVANRIRKAFIVVGGSALFLVVVDQVLNLIAIYKPRRLHRAARKLTKQMNRVYLWAHDRFDLGRNAEEVIIYHEGRKTGREYATPLCVSHCDEGFVVGAYWGPTADWFLNLRATPTARMRYHGEYHEVEAEVITLDEAHRKMGGPSQCGCWEQGRAEYCVLLRPVAKQSTQSDVATVPTTATA